MRISERYLFYIGSFLIYIVFLIYNVKRESQWAIDNVIALVFIAIVFSFNHKLKLQRIDFVLLNFGLLMHNMGAFAFYHWSWSIIEYDNFIHLFGSLAAGFILYNVIARSFHTKENHWIKKTTVDEHKFLLIVLIIALVTTLGVFVELIEYTGYRLIGPGEGLLLYGAGDTGKFGNVDGQYIDTMDDIIVNTIGAILGVGLYYFLIYKKRYLKNS